MARRRGRNEGSISQHVDGRWAARISVGWKTGKDGIRRRQRRWLYGETRADVAKKLRTELKKHDDGRSLEPGQAPTLAVYADQWLKGIEQRVKPATVRFYRGNLETHLKPALGHLRLNEIRRRHVLDVFEAIRRKEKAPAKQKADGPAKTLKFNTAIGAIRTLSALLAAAKRRDLIENNVALTGRDPELGRGKEKRPEPDPLSAEDVQRLAAMAREHFPRWFAFVVTGLRTGMRLSELLGLDWSHIDWTGKRIRVEQAFVLGELGSPKTHQTRDVDMTPQLGTALRWHRQQMRAFCLSAGLKQPEAVFINADGQRQDDSKARKVLKTICRKAGIRARGPHAAFRDTFATALLAQNVPLLYVSNQLGHSDASVTLKHYAKWLPRTDARHATVLDAQPGQWVSAGS